MIRNYVVNSRDNCWFAQTDPNPNILSHISSLSITVSHNIYQPITSHSICPPKHTSRRKPMNLKIAKQVKDKETARGRLKMSQGLNLLVRSSNKTFPHSCLKKKTGNLHASVNLVSVSIWLLYHVNQ